MQVNINITLTQDDIDAGLTADAAVKKAFPHGATTELHVDTSLAQDHVGIQAAAEAAAQEELDEQVEVAAPSGPATVIDEAPAQDAAEEYVDEHSGLDQEPEAEEAAPPFVAGVETDSAGVPWNPEIHSSNKKKYGATSKEPGRWQWKKGTNIVDRAAFAAGLIVAPVASPAAPAPAAAPSLAAPPAAIPAAENAVAVAEAVPPAAPIAGDAVPPAAVPPVVAAPATGELPATWPAFLQSLKQSGKTAGDITPLLASSGVETIAQLASNEEARNTIASQLGLVA